MGSKCEKGKGPSFPFFFFFWHLSRLHMAVYGLLILSKFSILGIVKYKYCLLTWRHTLPVHLFLAPFFLKFEFGKLFPIRLPLLLLLLKQIFITVKPYSTLWSYGLVEPLQTLYLLHSSCQNWKLKSSVSVKWQHRQVSHRESHRTVM